MHNWTVPSFFLETTLETSLSCFFLSCDVGKRHLIHTLGPHYLQEAHTRTFAIVLLIIELSKRWGGHWKLKESTFLCAVVSEALLKIGKNRRR